MRSLHVIFLIVPTYVCLGMEAQFGKKHVGPSGRSATVKTNTEPNWPPCKQRCYNFGFNIKMEAGEMAIVNSLRKAQMIPGCECKNAIMEELINENVFCKGFCLIMENADNFIDRPNAFAEAKAAHDKDGCDCSEFEFEYTYAEEDTAAQKKQPKLSGFELFNQLENKKNKGSKDEL